MSQDKFQKAKHEIKKQWFLALAVLVGVAYFHDPDQFILMFYSLSMVCSVVLFWYIARRIMFPGIGATELAKGAVTPISKAIVFAALVFFLVMMVWITVAKAMTSEEILGKAKPYIPVVKESFLKYWPAAPFKENECGKIEQETCVNLKKCWNPYVELKTSREYGFGLSQVTITYNPDGTERFNRFQDAKAAYKELRGWQWEDRWNPKFHISFAILDDRTNFKRMRILFRDDLNAWAGALICYNAGSGTVSRRRALCLKTKDCDPSKWFGGLDTITLPGENKLLYGTSLKVRRDAYPRNIIFKRSEKYRGKI